MPKIFQPLKEMEFGTLTINISNFDNFEENTHICLEDKVLKFIKLRYKSGANTMVESVLSFWFG
jgi:hypothetical protein